MSFTVRFIRSAATHFTFASPTPFLAPRHVQEHDDQQPPKPVALRKTWTVEGVLYGTETTLPTAWDALKAKIEDPTSYPDGIELVRDPATVIDSIRTTDGFDEFRVEELVVQRTDLMWRAELRFTVRVSARKRFVTGGGATGISANVAGFTQTESFDYDESGLCTRTLQGEIEVVAGASAVTEARALGYGTSLNPLPSDSFGFVTAGPEGVNVERLDRADRKARFVSIIRENAEELPSGVGPGFSVEIETRTAEGEEIETKTVTAVGPSAFDAVKAQRPAGKLEEVLRHNDRLRTASGVFVRKKPAPGRELRRHEFAFSGGGRPEVYTLKTGARPPSGHVLAFRPVEITEEIVVAKKNPSTSLDFKVPRPVVGLREDTGAWRMGGPVRTTIAKDPSGDEWSVVIRRTYRAPSFDGAFAAVMQSVFTPDRTLTLDDEIARINLGGLPQV